MLRESSSQYLSQFVHTAEGGHPVKQSEVIKPHSDSAPAFLKALEITNAANAMILLDDVPHATIDMARP
jgi:hypothetical protein